MRGDPLRSLEEDGWAIGRGTRRDRQTWYVVTMLYAFTCLSALRLAGHVFGYGAATQRQETRPH